MGEYAVDQFVRHRTQQAWGFGRVVSASGGYVKVKFEGCSGDKSFQLQQASNFLESVNEAEIPAETKAATLRGKSRKPKASDSESGECTVCKAKLNRSRYSKDGKWKSCPKCSTDHGTQHVYRRTEDFGHTPARETEENPDGIQSYCTGCRQEDTPALDGPNIFLCSDVDSQARKP